ncbi:pyruvate formate lyase family protein [Geobacter sp. DSM 9736]|uniref:pyruvate formate lyase family protein n=1 Tax=Geobacter sp. DSM 9736 TaxID=1277350 RepID=UPI000B512786|nr:pyruvate formate lyase family protein [Geobacter sp. DSM 9736]SNB47000.1 glycerol dehydratase, cobalamin-independent, large subunit [Geobacter sp. DSM 9736]
MSPSNQSWWSRSGKSLQGHFLGNLVLEEDSPEEIRIQKIRHLLLNDNQQQLSLSRARLFTEAYRQHEIEPPVIRKALACAHVLRNIPIPVIDNQLLMGTPAAFYGAIEVDPEYYAGWLLSGVEGNDVTELQYLPLRESMRVHVSSEDLKELEDEILPYWVKRHAGAHVRAEMERLWPDALDYMSTSRVFLPNFGKGFSHTILDFKSVLDKGLAGLKEEIQQAHKKLLGSLSSHDDLEKLHHYQAMLICADGAIEYAQRCAERCEEEARSNPEREEELRLMAEVCRNVPVNPANSWWEVLQSIHFMHMLTYLTDGGVSHSFGRMDVYLYPYYKKWVGEDDTSLKRAQELIECFFLKCFEYQPVRDAKSARGLAGDRSNDKITLGGVDQEGEDVTNYLSYRFLEALAHVHLKEPNVSIRVHRNSPDEFIASALEVLRLGGGLPQLLNDETIIPALLGKTRVRLEDARHYADVGCTENYTDPNSSPGADTNGHSNAGYFNLARVLELTMWNGVDTKTGKQAGPKTGEPTCFGKMEDVAAAFTVQLHHAIAMNVMMNHAIEYHFARTFPNPYLNLMHPGPREKGIDYVGGGCRYNWIGAAGVGLATCADSLMAIEELIFNQNACSWEQLLQALRQNWEGHEALRDKSLKLPRYGAGGKRAEYWARWLVNRFCDGYESHRALRGDESCTFVAGFFSMGIYLVLGEDVGATPDGRLAREMLAGSTGPSLLAQSAGFTATHAAVAALDSYRLPNGVTFNQVVPASTVATEKDLHKWADLVRTYFDLGGMSVQYSVLDADDLQAAQKDPLRYPDLIVRLGGYSARFVDLTREIQDEFIARLCNR